MKAVVTGVGLFVVVDPFDPPLQPPETLRPINVNRTRASLGSERRRGRRMAKKNDAMDRVAVSTTCDSRKTA